MNLMTATVDRGMWLYRHTLKRVKPLHHLGYRAGSSLLDLLSHVTHFETMEEDPLCFRLELLTRAYESETVDLINKIAKPGMVALDLGAHIGYYTRRLSGLVGRAGHVIAFEPNPRTFAVLQRNAGHSKNVTTVNLAVTDKEEDATLYDAHPDTGGCSLAHEYKHTLDCSELAPRAVSRSPSVSYAIRTTSIDSYLMGAGIQRVDLVKMDIEGAEMQAIRGMSRMLSAAGCLSMIMEFNPRALRAFGTEPLDVWLELRQMGFRVMSIGAKHKLEPLTEANSIVALVEEISDPEVDMPDAVNWFCQKGRTAS